MINNNVLVSLTVGSKKVRIGESLGIRYIKSYVNANGFDIDIIENQFLNLDSIALAKILNKYKTIGFSINYSEQINTLKELLPLINTQKILIYLGGHFASICVEKILTDFREIKFVIVADGEIPFLSLLQNDFLYKKVSNAVFLDENNRIRHNEISIPENLDLFPFPYRNVNSFYMGDKHFSVVTSRGCYNSCSYCSVGSFTKNILHCKMRTRSAENIFEELNFLNQHYGIQYITFYDDLFVGNDRTSKDKAVKLAQLLIKADIKFFYSIMCSVKAVDHDLFSLLYKAGLRNVLIGIENFTENALKEYNKKINIKDIENAISILRNIGIPIDYGFIMYYPEMVPDEILYNTDILQKYNLLNLNAITNVLQIYVGSDYENKKNENIQITRDNYTISYIFKNEKLNDFIWQCKEFAIKYRKLENSLLRFVFKSYTDNIIDIKTVNNLFDLFRDLLSRFVHRKYDSVFISHTGCDDIYEELDALHSEVNKLSVEYGLG